MSEATWLQRADARPSRTARSLKDTDIALAALTLGVDEASVRAVCDVESRGVGFLPDGRPTILFERHIMRRQLLAVDIDPAPFIRDLPNIVNTKTGGYVGNAGEYPRLAAAKQINLEAAICSASWGMFQIMGFHWKALGYDSPQDFQRAMCASEGHQIDAFIRFIEADPKLHKALKRQNWAAFAKRYNGPAYAKNKYDTKLADAYARHAA